MTSEREGAIVSAIKEMGVFRTPYPNSEVEQVVSKLIKENKNLQIKLENAEDILRGLKKDLKDVKEELNER